MRDSVSGLTPGRLGGLGGIAAVELAVRGVGGATVVDLVELVGEGVVVSIAVGLVGGPFGQVVADAAMWGLYVCALYTVLPELFPDSLSGLANDRGLVALLATGAVAVALPAQAPLGGTRQVAATGGTAIEASGATFQLTFFVMALWSGFVWAYLRFVRDQGIRADGSDTRRLLAMVDADIEDRLDTPPAERSAVDHIEVWFAGVLPALLFGFVVFALGIFVAVLSRFYPLPELLFVGAGVLGPVVARRGGFGPSTGVDADLERDIGTALFAVLRSEKGIGIAVSTLLGVAASMFVFFAALFVGGRALDPFLTALDAATTGGFDGWVGLAGPLAGVGAAATLSVAATLVLWTWVRLARRSVAFTSAWEQRGEDGERTEVTLGRPPWGTLGPVVLAATAVPVVFVTEWTRRPVAVYGLVWPVGVVAAALWFRHTMRRDPQPALTDNWLYPLSCCLEFGLLFLLGAVAPVSVDEFGVFVALITAFLLVLHFDPEVGAWLEGAGEPWDRFAGGTVGLLAIPLLGVGLLKPSFGTFAAVAGVASLAAAGLGVVEERQHDNET